MLEEGVEFEARTVTLCGPYCFSSGSLLLEFSLTVNVQQYFCINLRTTPSALLQDCGDDTIEEDAWKYLSADWPHPNLMVFQTSRTKNGRWSRRS